MISSLDKIILGSVGVVLTTLTAGAASFSWKMLQDAGFSGTLAAPVVADLDEFDGSVRTRHRETLAWTGAKQKQALRDGDRIRTLDSAHAEIRYGDGLVVYLDPNSQVTVHGMSKGQGERLVGGIQVVDGSIRAEVKSGRTLALRDASGKQTATVESTDAAGAAVKFVAPEAADGAVAMTVLEGGTEVKDAAGTVTTVAKGAEKQIGEAAPTPTPPVVVALATPKLRYPILAGLLPIQTSESPESPLRFRVALPTGVKRVEAQGRPCTVLDNGQVEIILKDLPRGMSVVDIDYQFADGRWMRQEQRVRVRE